MPSTTPAGLLVVISGPSGSGKSTVLRHLLQCCPLPLKFSVSATTRAPREGEVDGVNYHFLTAEQFAARRAAGEFLECCEVYGKGYWYGTLWSEVTSDLQAGRPVVLEIDVQGMHLVRSRFPGAVTIFVHSGSEAELERRLRGRGTETETQIQRRLEAARAELAQSQEYQHVVQNDEPHRAADEICAIITRLGAQTHAR